MKNHKNLKIIGLFFAITFLIQACKTNDQIQIQELEIRDSKEIQEQQTDRKSGDPFTMTTIDEGTNNSGVDHSDTIYNDDLNINGTSDNLSDDEIAGLFFMREEEKLAKDVYFGLYDLWGVPIFQNIASSEQTHTDAVKGLLNLFGLEDPADNSPTGTFVNQDLKKLYDELMIMGSQSLGDALKVGAAIEEIDILDLKNHLQTTQNPDIIRVYENLLRGSENHLRAFTSNLERQTGEIYQPQYLSQEDYITILASSSPRGGKGNGDQP